MGDFLWKVSVNGYRWTGDDPYLGSVNPYEWQYREYAPLAEFNGLFRTFADTPLTLDAVLDFANQYGHLGLAAGTAAELDDSWQHRTDEEWEEVEKTQEREPPWLEPFSLWVEQIELLRECVAAWDKAQGGNADAGTMLKLQRTVNLRLRNRTEVVFERDRLRGLLTLGIKPQNLLGALWLQLAMAISANKEHRSCPTCKRWFEVSPEASRKSRQYCSEACRSRAYRLRKETAQKLAAQGKSPIEIAAEMGSDVTTIKGWLKAPRK